MKERTHLTSTNTRNLVVDGLSTNKNILLIESLTNNITSLMSLLTCSCEGCHDKKSVPVVVRFNVRPIFPSLCTLHVRALVVIY